jgi:putative NADPH-quinone reductase
MFDTPLIILGSSRRKSDTRNFAGHVFKGTQHTLLDLLEHPMAYYDYEGIYPASDSFEQVRKLMLEHNILVFATPVYWYSMSALMKNLFDRFTDLVTIEKQSGRKLKGKKVFLLAVGTDEELPAGFEIPFKRTAEYLGMSYEGFIYFSVKTSLDQKQNIDSRISFLEKINASTKE